VSSLGSVVTLFEEVDGSPVFVRDYRGHLHERMSLQACFIDCVPNNSYNNNISNNTNISTSPVTGRDRDGCFIVSGSEDGAVSDKTIAHDWMVYILHIDLMLTCYCYQVYVWDLSSGVLVWRRALADCSAAVTSDGDIDKGSSDICSDCVLSVAASPDPVSGQFVASTLSGKVGCFSHIHANSREVDEDMAEPT
jgi:hypothetical protein